MYHLLLLASKQLCIVADHLMPPIPAFERRTGEAHLSLASRGGVRASSVLVRTHGWGHGGGTAGARLGQGCPQG